MAARDEPGVREHEAAQRAAARDEPGVREHERRQELRGLLIWHASILMENIYFIRHADYGMHLVFMVVGIFTYLLQHLVQEKNVAPMATCHMPVRTLTRN